MDWGRKRVLVTGDSGFVGSHLTRELKRLGAQVTTLTHHQGRTTDVRDWDALSGRDSLDIVYHLAGITYVPYCFDNPRETYEVNALGTVNLLELSRMRGVKRFILASSYVYGHPEYLPVDEAHPVRPANPYSRSKVMAEFLCQAYRDDYGMPCTVLRAFNIYGEGQSNSFLIPSILSQLASGHIHLDDPEPRRDFVHVSDVVDAYVKAGEYSATDFEIFNIGSASSHSVAEIVERLLAISHKPATAQYRGNRRRNEIMNVVADVRKAKEKLNWEPTVRLDDGLRWCVDYYLNSWEPHIR